MVNSIKGRNLVLSLSEDDGTTWEVIGGIATKEVQRDNPVSDMTNQATDAGGGNETEAAYNGYGTVTINGSGTVDTRTSATLAASKKLAATANQLAGVEPVLLLKFADSDETYEGNFIITSYAKTSEENGLLNFNVSFQNEGIVAFTQP